ncbi:hypothetical protein GCM10011611_65620 [Aliidongia dinghuensis]|uniref:Lysine-specific metallo-endopeptidase domain-containing protein n=1 Tax=Aliidongia dinghuensis TaxID=1867774 RepID=A0A8J2Z259_9PROT|nr:M35 family metallo-endopeptidase [Aliidongia dinghuensis]GGF50082.1 hypothetical protein GCM10011611_65620 [Aliidongia dinghuensis]
MERFSEAYRKCRKICTDGKFSDEWEKFLEKSVAVGSLLGSHGPNPKRAGGLDKLREKILSTPEGKRGELLIKAATNGKASGSIPERAATLKMLWHLYLTSERGGQNLWVYSPPVAYKQWVYDEIAGERSTYEPKLEKTSEVYTEHERRIMSTALAQALRSANNAVSKLGSANTATLDIVRRWFADENTTDAQVKTAVRKLLSGFKKIAAVCNSNHLVFSDEPIDRSGGGWKDYAFVDPTETLNVVYPQGAFLKAAGSTGRVWICVETIVHELSHRVVHTDDFAYDNSGLGPSKDAVTFSHAIRNADSWGYFCVDLAGMLAKTDRNRVLTRGQLLKAA